jgi:hypothetical protein
MHAENQRCDEVGDPEYLSDKLPLHEYIASGQAKLGYSRGAPLF